MRIERFPEIALALLNELPPRPGYLERLAPLFEAKPALLQTVSRLAISRDEPCVEDAVGFTALVERIGAPALLEIAITLLVREYMQRAFETREDRRYWSYLLACAVTCAELASPRENGKLISYVGGLLHDIGRLALIAAYPDKYANLLALADRMFREDLPFDLLNHERLFYGLDHFATGSWLAATWGMPVWLRAITGKFDEEAPGDYRDLVATVRKGTSLAHSLGFGYLRAAPRRTVREILGRLPASWGRLQGVDPWTAGTEHLQHRIEAHIALYGTRLEEEED